MVFTTELEYQQTALIYVFEGERLVAEENSLIGKFHLNEISAGERGAPKIEITFEIDANAILQVTAQDMNFQNRSQICITNDKGRLSKQEIEKMIAEAEKLRNQDLKLKKLKITQRELLSQLQGA